MKQILIILVMFFLSHTAFAAEIDLIVPKEANVDQVLLININIGQLKQPANAVSGVLLFDPGSLNIQKIIDGGSVINLWLKNPQIVSDGKLEFAGVTPGGLMSGKLFSLEFTSKISGQQSIKLQDIKFVLNDGSGAAYESLDQEAQINFTQSTSTQVLIEDKQEKDIIPPLSFEIQLAQDKSIFNNQWFAVFNFYDQDSGIAYYEVAESNINSQENLNWEKSTSPYLLKNQSKVGYLFVKAVDKEGNYRVSVLKMEEKNNSLNKILAYGIIFLVFVVIFGVVKRFKKQNV